MKKHFPLLVLLLAAPLFGQVQINGNTVLQGVGANSGNGVSGINTFPGNFTFAGAGVNCSGTTCTFPGASSNAQSIQGTPVVSAAPASGNVLRFDGTNWIPSAATVPAGVIGVMGSSSVYLQMSNGSLIAGDCIMVGADGGTADAGAPCGSGGGGGVPSINGTGGAFTFTGAGVSCSTTTCTFSGTGTGVIYTAPTLNFYPAVSSVSGAGTVINGSLAESGGGVLLGSEPFNQSNHINMQATGTATNVSGNFGSYTLALGASYWNGSTAIGCNHTYKLFIGSGTTPGTVEDHFGCPGLPNTQFLYGIDPSNVATSGANLNGPKFIMRGAYWTGTASALEDCTIQPILGAGANPTVTANHVCTGSTGAVSDQFAAITVTGPSLIESGVSTNTDISGELALSAATTASYTFANTYVSHPECWTKNQFNSSVASWVTYTGVASFTINFASAVTGTVSYGCIGRN